jgi:hypothetical protein
MAVAKLKDFFTYLTSSGFRHDRDWSDETKDVYVWNNNRGDHHVITVDKHENELSRDWKHEKNGTLVDKFSRGVGVRSLQNHCSEYNRMTRGRW